MRPQLLQVQNNSKISQGNRALNLDPNLSKAGYYGKTSRRRCTRAGHYKNVFGRRSLAKIAPKIP